VKLDSERQELVLDNLDLVPEIARRYATYRDEAISAGYLGLVIAAIRYDGRSAPFGPWAAKRVYWAMRDDRRTALISHHARRWDRGDHSGGGDPLERQEAIEAVRRAVGQLPRRQRQIVDDLMDGHRVTEIAARLGQRRDGISHQKQAAFGRLRGLLANLVG